MSIVDWIEESVPRRAWRRSSASCSTSPTTIEYGGRVERPELAEPPLPARLLRPGKVPDLRAVEREVPRPRRQRPDSEPDSLRSARRQMQARSTSSSRSSSQRGGTYTLDVPQAAGTKTVAADRVVLALPFSILRTSVNYSKAGFEPLKVTAIEEQGMGTNSKLHLQFTERLLGRARLQRRHVRRHGLPGHVGRDTRTARATRESSSTTPEGTIGDSFGSGTPPTHARAVPVAARAGAARAHRDVERPRGTRLTGRTTSGRRGSYSY